MVKSVIQMLLEVFNRLVAMTTSLGSQCNHSHSEEPFPNVQAELPLMQLHSISSCPVDGHQRGDQHQDYPVAGAGSSSCPCYISCICPAL